MASLSGYTSLNSASHMTTLPPSTRIANNNAAIVLSTVSASLSIVGTIIIIATYFIWKDIQTNSRLILVYISIADFFTAAGSLVTRFDKRGLRDVEDTTCVIQSFITTTSCLCSFFWTTYLGLYLFLTVARKQSRVADNWMLVFHITAWGIPLGIVTTALIEHKLGDDLDYVTSGWCWINVNSKVPDKTFWMLITGKAWEIASYFLITILYITVKCHIRSEIYHRRQTFITNSSLKAAQKADRKLSFVPLAFVLLRIWGTIRFFIFVYFSKHSRDKDLQFLIYLQGIGDMGQGFVNFLLFCFLSDKFQARFRRLFKSCYLKICWKDKNSWQAQVDSLLPKPTKHSKAQPIRKEESETSPLLYGSKNVSSDRRPCGRPA